MGRVTFTKKQNDLMRLFKQNKLPRLTVLQGSVRSGKTWISLILWALWYLQGLCPLRRHG